MSNDIIWVPAGPGMSIGVSPDAPLYDSENRFVGEPIGFHVFAWKPTRCRNGYWRWLCWLERHGDGTFTLGRGR